MRQSDRRRRRRESPVRYLVALLLALLVEGAVVGLLLLSSHLGGDTRPPRPPSSVALRQLSAAEWERNRGPQPPDSKSSQPVVTKPKKEEEKKPEERPQGQVVAVAPGNDKESPDAKYLAESSNTVEKETRAREQTPDYRNPMPQRTSPQKSQGEAQVQATPSEAGNGGVGADARPRQQGGQKRQFEVPDVRQKNEVALKQDPNEPGPGLEVANRSESDEMVGNSKRLRIQPGQPGDGEEETSQGHAGTVGRLDLKPSQAVMDRIIGAAPNDHLKDVEEGDGTILNTREWKYASFFNRVKQAVSMNWNPSRELVTRDPSGQIYAGRDRHTLVEVTLDSQGRLANISVAKSSGLDFLDLEAVESFKRAQPFPNPPPALLNEDSQVRFQFGFFLDMGGPPRMRLFRQMD